MRLRRVALRLTRAVLMAGAAPSNHTVAVGALHGSLISFRIMICTRMPARYPPVGCRAEPYQQGFQQIQFRKDESQHCDCASGLWVPAVGAGNCVHLSGSQSRPVSIVKTTMFCAQRALTIGWI